jgi:hypothetical protein
LNNVLDFESYGLYLLNNKQAKQMQQGRTIEKIKLFDFIPLLRIKYRNNYVRILLFNIIPIFKIKIKNE